MTDIKNILEAVKNGEMTVSDAELLLKKAPFSDLSFAKPDLHRKQRCGFPEVIYGEGKTAEEIKTIAENLAENGEDTILITRLSAEKAEFVSRFFDFFYNEKARIGVIGKYMPPSGNGDILVLTGGTSDIPVAEEAAITAEALGNKVIRIYDVGVAGLHRLLANLDEIMRASVIIAAAGMEGALASVVGGLASCPVIALPTSVGYGAAFGGAAALLSMLNSCASGVMTVNIDNGFGAGYAASLINHIGDRSPIDTGR